MLHQPAGKRAVAFATGPVLVVVALKSALAFAVAGRYGWHRCMLRGTLAELWPSIVATHDN